LRRSLHPWGSGRAFATSGSGILVYGSGCITYTDVYETTGSNTASVSLLDGTSSNGQYMADYTLNANQSTSEEWGFHWMPFYEGLYIVTNSGSAAGTVSVWVDHNCDEHVNVLFLAQEGTILEAGEQLAQAAGIKWQQAIPAATP